MVTKRVLNDFARFSDGRLYSTSTWFMQKGQIFNIDLQMSFWRRNVSKKILTDAIMFFKNNRLHLEWVFFAWERECIYGLQALFYSVRKQFILGCFQKASRQPSRYEYISIFNVISYLFQDWKWRLRNMFSNILRVFDIISCDTGELFDFVIQIWRGNKSFMQFLWEIGILT